MKLHELSKDLLRRYVKAGDRSADAHLDKSLEHWKSAEDVRRYTDRTGMSTMMKKHHDSLVSQARKHGAKYDSRVKYLNKADAKIAEESQLDERNRENKVKKDAHAIKLGYARSNYALFPKKPDRPGGLSAGILHKIEMDDSGHSKSYFYKKTADHLKRSGRFALSRGLKKERKLTEDQLDELSARVLSRYLIKATDNKKHQKRKHSITAAFQKWIQQKEERDQLAELSSKSTYSYFNKACAARAEAEKNGDVDTMRKRERGAFRAIDSIAKKEGLRSKPKRSLMKVKRYAKGTSFEESAE